MVGLTHHHAWSFLSVVIQRMIAAQGRNDDEFEGLINAIGFVFDWMISAQGRNDGMFEGLN
jgi:hypothetical protein